MCRRWLLVPFAIACSGGDLEPLEVHLGDAIDAEGEGRVDLTAEVEGERALIVHLDGEVLVLEASLGTTWVRPQPVEPATVEWTITGEGEVPVAIWARGRPAPAADTRRSMVWLLPELLDDGATIGLARVLGAAADDGHGGRLFDAMLRRFATTAHSERVAPADFADAIAAAQGADPSAWDLDALPFRVTGVHNRVDLAARGGGCGELRVSFASTDPIYAPFHLIALFRQEPADDDLAPDGEVHCHGTGRRWARLSGLEGGELLSAARAILDATIRRDRFLLLETVELTISPWEWRQWTATGVPDVLDNPPLFQTVDTARLNQAGPERDDLLAWAAANREAILERTILVPERFRAPSARVTQGVPRPLLDLGDPILSASLEIVGCPACHTNDAEFLQTSAQRAPSPFYEDELAARAARLDALARGELLPAPPFGPLSE